MSTSLLHADLTLSAAGASIAASCVIKQQTDQHYSSQVLIAMDRATLASRIAQVKDVLPAAATNVWAGLADPLAAPTGKLVADRFNECMEKTVGEGSALYKELSDLGLKSILNRVNQMPDGSRLTIHTDCAFFPWEILYPEGFSANWPKEHKAALPLKPQQIWGYRFVINYDLLVVDDATDWSALRAKHNNGPPFISVNLNRSIGKAFTDRAFKPIQHHENFCSQRLSVKNEGAIYDAVSAILGQLYSNDQRATFLYLYCHGRNSIPFSANNIEQLEFDENNRLAPADLRSFPNVYSRAPIVFLNSCTSGQPSPLSFTSFHVAFRQKQAMGIIGTAIEMPATFGAAFGCKLLEYYINGTPLGVGLYAMRRDLVNKGNPLGLFYLLQCPPDLAAPRLKTQLSEVRKDE